MTASPLFFNFEILLLILKYMETYQVWVSLKAVCPV